MEIRQKSPWVLEQVVVGGLTRLDEGVTTIGRNPICTITVTSDYVSRDHAEFQVEANGGNIQIKDLGSTNGIFVNDNLYNGTVCTLRVGDRIGIGVSVNDDQVSSDGKYPVFVLRHVPIVDEISEGMVEEANVKIVPPSPVPSAVDDHNDSDQVYVSDSEYDEADCVDDFVHPQGANNPQMEKCTTLQTSSATLGASNANIISANIRSIFGEINLELLSKLCKGTRDIAQQIPAAATAVIANDVICISSDEECDEDFLQPAKSPQLFDDSFNNYEAPVIAEKENVIAAREPSVVEMINTPVVVNINTPVVDTLVVPCSSNIEYIDDNEDDELYFTQKLLEELREELPDSDNEATADYKVDEGGSLIIAPVKLEKCSLNVSDIINLDNEDDDEFDEALESKVNKWSDMLFSQSFSNSFNVSQVYEDDVDTDPATTECIFIDVDDYDDSEYEQNLRNEVRIKTEPQEDEPLMEQIVSAIPTSTTSEKQKVIVESPLIRRKSSNARFMLSSSSSEEDQEEAPNMLIDAEFSSSSKIKTLEQQKHARKLSITEEIPSKKPRLTSKAKANENEDNKSVRLRKRSSSSHRKYSRSDSNSSSSKPSRSAEDQPDELTKDDKPKRHSSDSLKKINGIRKSKDDKDRSTPYRRSSSSTNETNRSNYLSAAAARRKSVSSHSPVVEAEYNDFAEIKKVDNLTLTKQQIRGPTIISPPQLPKGKGKLRGVSAVQQRIADSIKGVQSRRDLKQKWIEKPDKRKEQAKSNAIKQDRKQKLKELADKKHSEAKNISKKNNTHKNDNTNEKPTKIKNVKITSVNRGSFLTVSAPTNNIKKYRIPKTSGVSKQSARAKTSKKAIDEPTNTVSELKSSTIAPKSFSQALASADVITQNGNIKPTATVSRNRVKSIDIAGEQKERAPPRQSNKGVTFVAQESYFEETARLQGFQEKLAEVSSMKSPLATMQQKKKKNRPF